MTTLILLHNGRNLLGMLSHVFLPIITAFILPPALTCDVRLLKYAMSSGRCQGMSPLRPIPPSVVVTTTAWKALAGLGGSGRDCTIAATLRGWRLKQHASFARKGNRRGGASMHSSERYHVYNKYPSKIQWQSKGDLRPFERASPSAPSTERCTFKSLGASQNIRQRISRTNHLRKHAQSS